MSESPGHSSTAVLELPPRAAQHTGGVAPSRVLQEKLERLRRRQVRVAVLFGISILLLVGIEVLALVMFFDWLIELPWGMRLLLLLGQAALLGWLAWQYIARPILRQPSEDELALEMEKAHPELQSRLIASVQLTRPRAVPPGASTELVAVLVQDTEAAAGRMDFGAIVPTERLKQVGIFAAFVVCAGLAGFLLGRPATTDLLKRALLSQTPVPRKTRVVVVDANKVIGRGDNVRLEATARGLIPNRGKVTVRYRGRRDQVFTLEPAAGERGRFGRQIENVQDTFFYQVRLNDGVSAWHEVKAIARPTVALLECEQHFPAYTGLKPVRRSLGDLALLAGSRLKLQVTATKPLREGAIKCAGTNVLVPLQINGANPRLLTGELPIPAQNLNGFSIAMRDTDGMESRDAAIYRLEVIPDKPPVVRITHPDRKEELITRQATMIVGMDLLDDFAMKTVRLHYRVDTVDGGAEKNFELDLDGEQPQRLRRRHEWRIGGFTPPLSQGSRIEFWLEAVDNNNATGPGVGRSEHQFAKVVSPEEKRADLLNRAGDYLGSITDIAGDQDRLNRGLGEVIREKRVLR